MEIIDSSPEANRGSKKNTNEIQQSHYSNGDAVYQFKNAMIEAGIAPPDTIIDVLTEYPMGGAV